jgi:hypothetical protein
MTLDIKQLHPSQVNRIHVTQSFQSINYNVYLVSPDGGTNTVQHELTFHQAVEWAYAAANVNGLGADQVFFFDMINETPLMNFDRYNDTPVRNPQWTV